MSGDRLPSRDELNRALQERVAAAERAEARDAPGTPTLGDDSWQQFARDLEQAGHSAFAKRAWYLIEHDVHTMPQIEVSPPVPEPQLPEVAMVELSERPVSPTDEEVQA